jgi:fibronectin-binding autotransporter adhesin
MPLRAATLAILGTWMVCAAVPAHGGTFNVTTTSDTGTGSLRQAVLDANDSPDASNTITFTLPANSTITLASSLEDIAKATLIFDATAATGLTIDGPGANFLTFTTSSTSAEFHANSRYTDGTLTFDESDTGTIDGTLNGVVLTLIKTGAGTTTLSPGSVINLTGATSAVRVEQGTFDVDGSLTAASLLVAPDATLIVDGTVTATGTVTDQGTLFANGMLTAGSLIIESQGALVGDGGSVLAPVTVLGRVAPSTATGSLSVQGPVSFGASSIFEVEIGPGNAGDSLTVTNAVTIQPGAQLQIVADPGAITTDSTVTVLTAAGGLSGQFASTDYAFFDELLDYQANSLTVTLTSTGQNFASFASTPNQAAVASLLNAAAPTATGDLQTVFDSLNTALASEIPTLLDAIGGESLTAFATARQILAERTARALHRRARDPAWGQGRAFYLSETATPDVAADDDPPAPRDRVRAAAWFDGIGLFGELEGDTGEAEVDTLLYGGTLGADAWIADRVVVGLAAGYARSDVDLDGREADVFGDTVQGALYAGFVDPRGFVSAYGRYAYTYQASDRRIESTGLLRKAHAHWDAHDYGAGGEAGITLVSFREFAVQPIAGVDWLRLTEESYTERDAGSLALIVDPEALETTTARFGGRMFGRFDMDRSGTLVPELRAFYQREFGDRERVLNARLSGAPGLPSTGVRGPELPRDNLILGLGWGVLVGGYLTVTFDYDAVLGSDRVEHQGNVAVRALF